MAEKSLSELARKMREIEIAVLSTKTEGGAIAGRPMANNRQVEFDGDAWFFSYDGTRTVSDIEQRPQVSLAYQGGMAFHVTVEGEAEIIRDKDLFEEHWEPHLERWFPEGTDTEGMVLIKVHARRIHYWMGEDDGEIVL